MSCRKTQHFFEEFFRIHEMLNRCKHLAFVDWEKLKTEEGRRNRDFLADLEFMFEPHLSNTRIDKTKFRKQLSRFLAGAAKPGTQLFSETKLIRHITDFLWDHYRKTGEQIAEIPNTLYKAYDMLHGLVRSLDYTLIEPIQIYDAMVLLADELSDEIPRKVFEIWKKDYEERNQYHAGFGPFWLSRTGFESLDSISHLLFREKFHVGGFNDIFDEARNDLLTSLLDESQGPRTVLGARNDLNATMLLWQISRSTSVAYSLNNGIEISLDRLFAPPTPHKWTHYYEKLGSQDDGESNDSAGLFTFVHSRFFSGMFHAPSITTIALLCVATQRLNKAGKYQEKISALLSWLIDQQNADGSWNTEVYQGTDESVRVTKDVFTTLLGVEALWRSGLSQFNVDLGWQWILKQQNKYGGWDREMVELRREWLPFPLNTVLVLEFADLSGKHRLSDGKHASNNEVGSVFLSYSRKDWEEFAEPLVDKLKNTGYQVWVDQHLIRGGQVWLDEMNKALRTCTHMILCVSPTSLNSKWVKMEYLYFINHEKPLLPLICVPADIPAELDIIQSVSYDDFPKLREFLHG